MAIKYINNFQSKALQNLPKNMILGLKSNHLATLLYSHVTEENHTMYYIKVDALLHVAKWNNVDLQMDQKWHFANISYCRLLTFILLTPPDITSQVFGNGQHSIGWVRLGNVSSVLGVGNKSWIQFGLF
jgi:hypothetical protein